MSEITTKWVNLRIVWCVADYVNVAGYSGNGYCNKTWETGEPSSARRDADARLGNFSGLAAISLDEYRCSSESCNANKHQLRIEGMIPGAVDNSLDKVEVHAYARTSMNEPRHGEDEFLAMTSWSGKLTGIICGESLEVRHTPPPPGFPWKIRSGQTLSTWAKSGPELPCNVIDNHHCPWCRAKAMEEHLEHDEARVRALIKNKNSHLDDEEE